MRRSIQTFIAKRINPARVFIALLILALACILPAALSAREADESIVEPVSPSILNLDTQNAWAWQEDCMVCVLERPSCHGDESACCQRWKNECAGEDPPPPSYQPPSIYSSIGCDLWGNGGWCRSNARLSVWAADPQGFAVTITGTNPALFCVSGCDTYLVGGQGTATYTGVAVTSGLSASGAKSWAYDPQPPTITTSISGGTSNGNGWYASSLVFSAAGSDTISGMNGAIQISLDNGASWQSMPVSLGEGVHVVTTQGSDIAGNMLSQQETFKIDLSVPAISIETTGTTGNGGWYVSPVMLDALAADDLSGVTEIQHRINGGTWTNGDSVTLRDGVYAVDFQAFDAAGNSASVSQSQAINIDTTPPTLSITNAGTIGTGGWFVSPATLTAISSDNLSGVVSAQYRIDGGAWIDGDSVTLTDGTFTVDFLVIDAAGNSKQVSQTISVDTTPPVLTHSIAGTLGNAPWYVSNTKINISASDLTSGIETIEYSLDGGARKGGDLLIVQDGVHIVALRATDTAGNQTQYSFDVQVDTTPPVAKITSHLDGAVVGKAVDLGGDSSDAISGVASVRLSIDDSPWVDVDNWSQSSWEERWFTGYAMNGFHTISLRVEDNAGNTSFDTVTINVENRLPFLFGPAAPVPTSTLIPSPIPTFVPTVIPTSTLPKPTAEASLEAGNGSGSPVVAPTASTEPPSRKTLGKHLIHSWRPYTIAAGLFTVFALSFVLDRRPSAHRKTAEILLGIMKNNTQQE